MWEDATMWHRFAMILILSVAAAVPALAQQAGTDQKLQQEIEAVFNGWLDVYNRGDGKAAIGFLLPNAPFINPNGIVRGGPEYVNRVELQQQQNVKVTAKIDQIQAVGPDAAYALGPWTSTFGPNGGGRSGGMWLQLYERRADGWKISASSFTRVGGPQGNAGANAGANGNAGANAPRGGPAANPQADQARRQRP
ncbi:MAG TPA: nuclear transport factor 2 family protein [Xanthobacteraceae bacterium]|nr:nuclear transport factor 2 family protein [Xanthobacteraceae bacterium]